VKRHSEIGLRVVSLCHEIEAMRGKPFFVQAQAAPALVFVAASVLRDLVIEFEVLRERVAVTVARVDNMSGVVFKTEEKIL
jgi:hypothetical protein